jgi:hypothetical protein
MKAITKSKRRVTLSICGLGMLDESEIETIPQSQIEYLSTTIKEPSEIIDKMSDQQYEKMMDAQITPAKPNAVKEEKEVTTEIVRPKDPTPEVIKQQTKQEFEAKPINIENLMNNFKAQHGNVTLSFDEWYQGLKDVEFKGKPAKQISLGAPGLIAEPYSKDGAEPKTYRITNTQTKKWVFVPIWKVNCPKDYKDQAYIEIPCDLMLAEKEKWEKILA